MRRQAVTGWLLCVMGLGASGPALAANLVVNGDFDTEIAPWVSALTLSWDDKDRADSPSSGSLRVLNDATTDPGGFFNVLQCVPLSGPRSLIASAFAHKPPGQAPVALGALFLAAYSDSDCIADVAFGPGDSVELTGSGWHDLSAALEIPANAQSVSIGLGIRKIGGGGSVVVHFDDVSLEEEVPAPPGAWLSDSELPDFEFQVRIGGDRTGKVEKECIRGTVCLSGALAGRSEVFLRVVGPKPNGYLWPTIVKFTTNGVEVWLRQKDTGIVKYYTLRGASPGFDELPGLFDRFGFLP